jgi:PAS domain S-box-containing protein
MEMKYGKISKWSFIVVIFISLIALAGWMANNLLLARINENYIPMAPVTGLMFIAISGISIYVLKKSRNDISIQIILSILLFINCIILIDSSLAYPLNIEGFFSPTNNTFNDLPIGKMSPLTIILFLISLISLFLINNPDKKLKRFSIYLCSFGILVTFLLVLGYMYHTPLFYQQPIIPPAFNTSISFAFLFSGILFGFGMDERPMNLFVGESLRARLMRNFFPTPLIILVVAGWLDTILFHFFYEPVIVSAIVTIASLLGLGYLIIRFSNKIGSDIDNIFAYRRKVENKLLESELHFRTLADSGQALIWTAGTDKKCDYFNKTWLEFTGRTIEQELGDGWVEGVHPDDLDFCINTYDAAFERRESFSMDYRLRHRDGTYRWIQDNGTPRFNTRDEFVGYIGHCLDITEIKRAEKKLKESEEQYRLITNALTDYIFSTQVLSDGTTKMEWIVGAIESISGYTLEEYSERGGWRSIIHPDDYPIDDNALSNLLKNRDIECELRNINKNGEIVWVQIFAHPVWNDKENRVTQIFGAVKNITDRKVAEKKLSNSELKFRELLEKVNLIAVIIDQEGKITFCNNYLLNISGYTKDEMMNKDWFDLMIPDDHSEVKAVFIKGLQNGDIAPRFENPILTKDGKKLDIVWSNTVQRNADGIISGIASIGEDITERKNAEEKIRTMNQELEQRVTERTIELENQSQELINNQKALLNLVKDLNDKSEELSKKTEQLQLANKELETFSYTVSHDLRAPLRAINGFVKILREDYEDKFDEEGKRICNIVETNATKMGQLIDDLLSFSRLARSEIRQMTVDMDNLVQQTISELVQNDTKKRINFNLGKLPKATCDLNLIRQVWTNLLSNAIKYSSLNEEINIEIGSSSKDNEIVYFVRDNGIGFDMNYAHKLFGVFQRLHNMKEFEGTGVGLAIVQQIVHRHGGRVWAEGNIGKGAIFYFSLPRFLTNNN